MSQYDQPGSASLSLLILTVCEISNLGQDLTIFCFEFCQGLQCNEVKRIIFFRTMFKLPSPKFDIGGPEFRPKPLDPAEGATWDRADDEEMKLLKLALWNHEPDEEAQELEDMRLSLVSLQLEEEEDGPIDGQEKEESMPAERPSSESETDGRSKDGQAKASRQFQ